MRGRKSRVLSKKSNYSFFFFSFNFLLRQLGIPRGWRLDNVFIEIFANCKNTGHQGSKATREEEEEGHVACPAAFIVQSSVALWYM